MWLGKKFLADYKDTVLDTKVHGPPSIRGTFGEATIKLKSGDVLKKQRPYQILGNHRVSFENKIRRFKEENQWLEDGVWPWNSPTLTVPKPNKDDRVVINYRYVNDSTETDAQPLPRIDDIRMNQGKFRIWRVLDMNYVHHQVYMKKEHRHITCIFMPRGTK